MGNDNGEISAMRSAAAILCGSEFHQRSSKAKLQALAKALRDLHLNDIGLLQKCDPDVRTNLMRCVSAAQSEECTNILQCERGITAVISTLELPCNASLSARKRAERFLLELARLIQIDELQAA